MSIQAHHSGYTKLQEAERHLEALESLKSVPLSELHSKYRTLPLTLMYLIASHFDEGWIWLAKAKWEMFKIFDKALQDPKVLQNSEKISQSIDSAIGDQHKIIYLRKINAVLLDPTKTAQEKTGVYREIERTDGAFFDQIKHCIWVADEKNSNAGLGFVDKKIDNAPDAPLQQAVIKKMIWILKEGYGDCRKYSSFFENLMKTPPKETP